MAVVDLHNLTIAYNGQEAISDINLRIREGERVAFIGPSGAGKTTLLLKIYELASKDASFIHQQYGLVPQLSVFHNIYIGKLDMYPLWKNIVNYVYPISSEREKVKTILEQLGIEEKISVKVSNLSGGQQQRVAVGRAMYRDSPVIIADEPVASIDPHHGRQVVEALFHTGKTTIASLHSVEFALNFAKRIVGIKAGQILFDLPTSKLKESHIDHLYSSPI